MRSEKILSQLMKLRRLHWLGHVLRRANTRLPYHTLFSVHPTWRSTWHREMRKCTVNLIKTGVSSLRRRSPKDLSTKWLDTLKDMTAERELAIVFS